MMRVITGTARGIKLAAPEGEHTRPTAERVKEAVFSMIQFETEGRKVLDLFAGSGQLGIEALSRGAAHAAFVERDKKALACIRENLKKTKLEDDASVYGMDVMAALGGYMSDSGEYDIIFADPPYADSADLLDGILRNPEFSEWGGNALLLWELPDYRSPLKVFPENWHLKTIRELGASRFLLIERCKTSE